MRLTEGRDIPSNAHPLPSTPLDYSPVTETPGVWASSEQRARLFHRYRTAAQFCAGKDVLEVACGSGLGLGYLARTARRVVGADYTEANLRLAHEHYGKRIDLLRLDAHFLPFASASFDALILFEAVYYLASVKQFFSEARRVLRKHGLMVLCTVNKQWSDFNPSQFSVRYFSARELAAVLWANGFRTELFGAFPVNGGGMRDRATSLLKRAATTLHLVPKTFKGKRYLKRIFFGKLTPLGPELREGSEEYIAPKPISCESDNSRFKILYAIGFVP